jgi:NADH dehydrogenase
MLAGRGETPHRYVAIDDVAALCAHLAVAPDPPEVVEFGGPEALTAMQVVAAFEAATGKRFKVRHLPRAMLSVGHRLLARVQPDITLGFGLALFFDAHASTWDDAPLRKAGIEPRPASAFIARAGATQA